MDGTVNGKLVNNTINITGDGVTVRADEKSLITYNNQSLRANKGYAEVIFVTADGLIEPKGPVAVSGDTLSNFMLGSKSKINIGSNVTVEDSAIKDSFNFNAQNKSSVINLKNVRILENSTATINGGTADDTINVDKVKGEGLVMINGGGGKNSFNIVGSTAAVALAAGDKVTLDDSEVGVHFGKLEKYDVERYGVIIADGKSAGIDDPVILEVHEDYIQILGGTGIMAEGFVHDEYNFLRDKNGVRIIDLYTNSQLTTMPISKGVVGNYVNITAGNTPYVFQKKPNEGQTLFFMGSKLLSNVIAEENVKVKLEDSTLQFSGKGSVNLDNDLFNRFNVKLKLTDGMQLRVADTDPLNINLENITVDGGAGADSITADGKLYIEGGAGADNIIVGGGATVKTDSDDTVTVKGKSSAVVNDTTIENLGDVTATFNGNNEITFGDGWKGTIDGNASINLSEGTFTLNGTTYTNKDGKLTYSIGDEIFTYTGSTPCTISQLANAENWRSNVIHITVNDGVIPLKDIREKTTFEKSDGTVIAKTRDGKLIAVDADKISSIDATNFNDSLTIDKSLLNVEIKTDNGTYKVDAADNVILNGGNITGANTITVKAGKVTAENGVTVKTEGITSTNINGKVFNFEGNSEFVISEKSARAINGNFNVSDSLNLRENSITVKKSKVKARVDNGVVTSITGLNAGGTVTYNGKTYQRKGDSITLNRITYDIDDTTNLLTIIPVDTYTKITDTIDLTNAKDGAIFAINDEYIVAYLKIENGKPILTKGP